MFNIFHVMHAMLALAVIIGPVLPFVIVFKKFYFWLFATSGHNFSLVAQYICSSSV